MENNAVGNDITKYDQQKCDDCDVYETMLEKKNVLLSRYKQQLSNLANSSCDRCDEFKEQIKSLESSLTESEQHSFEESANRISFLEANLKKQGKLIASK